MEHRATPYHTRLRIARDIAWAIRETEICCHPQVEIEAQRNRGVRGHVGDAVANEYARQVNHRTSFRGRDLILVVYFTREHWKIAALFNSPQSVIR